MLDSQKRGLYIPSSHEPNATIIRRHNRQTIHRPYGCKIGRWEKKLRGGRLLSATTILLSTSYPTKGQTEPGKTSGYQQEA
jgi:hypothetical protein